MSDESGSKSIDSEQLEPLIAQKKDLESKAIIRISVEKIFPLIWGDWRKPMAYLESRFKGRR